MKKFKNIWVLSTLSLLILGAACSQKMEEVGKADPNVNNSLKGLSKEDVEKAAKEEGSKSEIDLRSKLALDVLKNKRSRYLLIQKSALNKEFLLSASAISQRVAATSSGLQSRVVSFTLKGEDLFLVESTEGNVVSPTLPAALILTEMPILLETKDAIVLDFNSGMRTIFAQGNWYASDMQGRAYSEKENGTAMGVRYSYLDSIKALDDNYLEIRQVAQVAGSAGIEAYEIRYFLSPYKKSETYKPLESPMKFDQVGYFESPPILEKSTGRTLVHSTIFDATKPIKFHVSSNTPKEYQAAVIEGILYWNRALGKDLITAEMAPEGLTAPDPRHNIVQWVEWDQAGFAYADALMDPRTGEIKHAQVYMTSAFAWGGKLRARTLSRALSDQKTVTEQLDGLTRSLGLKGMNSSILCLNDRSAQIAQVAQVALSSELSEEAMLRLSQDYVREVIAHEIGHTLGLRHNFAGNLGANKSVEEIQERFEQLVKDETTATADVVTSNSVMEYQAFPESVINGRQIARGEAALAYDTYALKRAYLGETLTSDLPIFCTDSHATTYQDCVRFDRGRNPVEGAKYTLKSGLKNLPITFVEAFLTKVGAVNDVERGPVTSVEPDPKALAAPLMLEVKSLTSYLDASLKSLILERRYEVLSSIQDKDLLRDRYNWLSQHAATYGSWEKLFFDHLIEGSEENLLSETWVSDKLAAVKDYLAKPIVRTFVGRDGKTRTLSDGDVKVIEAKAEVFFKEVRQQMVSGMLAILKASKWNLEIDATDSIEEGGLVLSLEAAIAEFVPTILTQKSTLMTKVPQADGSLSEVASFDFKSQIRTEAASLMAPTFVDLVSWSKVAREATRDVYREILLTDLGVTKVKQIEELIKAGHRKLQIWWKAEKAIWTTLGGPEAPEEKEAPATPASDRVLI